MSCSLLSNISNRLHVSSGTYRKAAFSCRHLPTPNQKQSFLTLPRRLDHAKLQSLAHLTGLSVPDAQQSPQQLPWTVQAQQLLPKVAAAAAVVAVLSLLVPYAAHAATAGGEGGSSLIKTAISFVLHLDKHLSSMIQQHGTTTYAILWTIVFCETGLVLTPFLPGDSLLFAAGAFAGMGQLNISLLFAVFMTSAVLGDAVNYAIGNKLGRWALDKQLLKQKYIDQTEAFYDKYGGKTVVLARFVPIVRTFAPFVAGIGSMSYSKFAMYNVGGALVWTVLFLGAGFFFGNLPAVQHNFTLVVLGIVAVSVLPVALEVMAARKGTAVPQVVVLQLNARLEVHSSMDASAGNGQNWPDPHLCALAGHAAPLVPMQ